MKFEDLKFERLTHPAMFKFIPRELFEQVKDPNVNVDNLYKFGPMSLASETTFIYVMFDPANVVKGVLWASINKFTDNLEVSILSVDKEYQGGNACKVTLEFLQDIKKEHHLNKIRLMSPRGKNYQHKYERVYKQLGLKESNVKVMEI